MKYISMKKAAKLAGMEYERFRYWIKTKRGPKPHYILGRIGFVEEDVRTWKPQYSENWGGNRYL